jgi:predicted N-acyltransferase
MNVYRGAEISDELLRAMFDVYLTTIENNPYGRQYLNVDFFERLGGAFRQHLCFVTAERVRALF